MKNNKLFVLGVLALIFGLVLVGCNNGVQEVKIVYDKAAAPTNVWVVKYYGGFNLTFDAVENATQYAYYMRENGSKAIITITPTGSLALSGNDQLTASFSGSTLTTGKTYEVGVQTQLTFATSVEPSDVVWTELTY
ncbi:MAG: hypothetical protein LBU00_01925 [Treponema sp.]|jgi:beta-xylosidase|nr:hypothetical protein [Treponema sp.]